MRNYIPLPHETTIRKYIYPDIIKFITYLFDSNCINNVLDEFISNEPMNATLVVDAASFKAVTGEKILEKFPHLKSIIPDHIYNSIFVFYLEPINLNKKPFPVHVDLKENGFASDLTLQCIKEIISKLESKKIIIDFICTDGDHKYDDLHENFFDIIFHLHKANFSFIEIVALLSETKMNNFPLSDLLHLLKNLRSALIFYGVEIDNAKSACVLPENLNLYFLGKAISDKTSHGKMKDNYPFMIFSSSTIEKAIQNNDWNFVFYALPFNLIINAVRNPYLSFELRKYNLETAFYFMINYLYQMNDSISPPLSRIGIIRMINTIIGITIALEKYDFVHLGHLSSHPVENYFGALRIACNYDHSLANIFRGIGKSIFIR